MKPFVLLITWIVAGQPPSVSIIEMETEQACLVAQQKVRDDFNRRRSAKRDVQLFAACLDRNDRKPNGPKNPDQK